MSTHEKAASLSLHHASAPGQAIPQVGFGVWEVPDSEVFGNGFKRQWEEFLVSWATGTPYPYDLLAGARGVQLAEAGLTSAEQGRKVTLDELSLD